MRIASTTAIAAIQSDLVIRKKKTKLSSSRHVTACQREREKIEMYVESGGGEESGRQRLIAVYLSL